MRPDVDYLKDIVEYADDVTKVLNGCSLDARVSDEVKERWSDVPWRRIIGFRNRIVHGLWGCKTPNALCSDGVVGV